MKNKNKTILLILGVIFVSLSIYCISFAWVAPNQEMPSGELTLINTSIEDQTKSGSLTIEQDLTVNGKANICELVYFDNTGEQEKCSAGYYVTEMLAGSAKGYMLCCKVENPPNN